MRITEAYAPPLNRIKRLLILSPSNVIWPLSMNTKLSALSRLSYSSFRQFCILESFRAHAQLLFGKFPWTYHNPAYAIYSEPTPGWRSRASLHSIIRDHPASNTFTQLHLPGLSGTSALMHRHYAFPYNFSIGQILSDSSTGPPSAP